MEWRNTGPYKSVGEGPQQNEWVHVMEPVLYRVKIPRPYQSGCVATCTERSLSQVTDGTCSGIGCCQTAIPRGMDYYQVGFDVGLNTSQTWRFSRCSYAMLIESASFNFSAAYISTTKFNETKAGQAPLVVDWAIRNGTASSSCEVTRRNETGTYACLSGNSKCVDSANRPGVRVQLLPRVPRQPLSSRWMQRCQ